ncbi:MAG: aminoglycoside phosphotransferase family protein [bacterium]|nr:aminoglycoside phosphotransferase family protein [bacterium]
MHDNEFPIDDGLVRGLLDAQFPEWAELALSRINSSGTVHAIYRLGTSMAVRLPRAPDFAQALERETAILPILGPLLPTAIPELVAVGRPTGSYPSPWSVLGWIEGEPLAAAPTVDWVAAADRLGEFVTAMRAVSVDGEMSTNQRGRPLDSRDTWTRDSIAAVADEFDATVTTAIWESALAAPAWDGTRKWIHGDLLPGNLLVADGELAAVIDFGECAIGNPTHDLIAGWWASTGPAARPFGEPPEPTRLRGTEAEAWLCPALSGRCRTTGSPIPHSPSKPDRPSAES